MSYKKIGIIMIIVGLLGVIGGRLTYSTGESTSTNATQQKIAENSLPPAAGAMVLFVFPVVGVLVFFGGVALIVIGKRPFLWHQ